MTVTSSPSRIVLVTAHFRPHVGGIERFVENLAGGLAGRGHQVTVLCCRTDGESARREDLDGYAIERVPASVRPERHLGVPYPIPEPVSLGRTLRRLLRSSDVVHVQDALYATSLAALVASRRRRVASVLTQHIWFTPQRARWLDVAERSAIATVGRCARLAGRVATFNPAVAERVREVWGIGDVRILPVGVARGTPGAFDVAAARRELGVPPAGFLALFVGRDVPTKSLDVFLDAAGEGYGLVAVTDRREAAGATVLPFMAPERLRKLYGCVDAFVQPSKTEGLPYSLQEALAAGLPVVTTRQPGYEHFLSGDDVLFVERDAASVRAALRRLVDEPDLARVLAARSRRVAERHFGLERFLDAYEQLYEEARGRGCAR